MNLENFGVVDYVIFLLTVSISTGIGIYFGCFGSKQNSATEYLYGKKGMSAIPIGLSLYSSAVSAITIIGTPSEIYIFGSPFIMNYFGIIVSLVVTWNFVLPVFCGNLLIRTPYEYYELRFNYKVRVMATLIYIIHTLLYMPVVLYGATLAFSELTGIPLVICTTAIGGICVFYTLLGGFSAVIWTDTLQATLMFGSCIFVLVKGIIDVGGFSVVWERAEQGGRLNFFEMTLNPFQRITFWSSIIGMCITNAAHSGCGASALQRYLALRNEKQARISTFISVSGTALLGIVTSVIGLSMYASYYNCDPVQNKEIKSSSKLVSHYIAQTIRAIPGFLGFFSAGLLSAGLSTLSAELNTVSGLIYHCFVKKMYRKPINEYNGALIMKIIVFINGLYYIIIAPFMDRSKYLFPLALTIGSLTYGAKLGTILLGTTFPKSNSIGVIVGTITSLIVVSFISIGALYYDVQTPYALPVSTSNCTISHNNITTEISNLTSIVLNSSQNLEPPFIFKLSFMYYPVLGTLICVIVGVLVSYLTGVTDIKKIDQKLIIPLMRPKMIEICADEKLTMLKDDQNK